MPYAPGHLIRVSIEIRDSRWPGNKWRNILKYRVFSGEASDSQGPGMPAAFAAFASPILSQLALTTFFKVIRVTNLSNLATPEEQTTFDDADEPGVIGDDSDDIPQASACFVRHAYQRGRTGIGRFFLGPLPSRFTNTGFVVVDPVGNGDLTGLTTWLGDPWTHADLVMRPVVVSGTASTAASNNDVRTVRVANLVTYMRSRRLGIGE